MATRVWQGQPLWRRLGIVAVVVLVVLALAAWIASMALRPHFSTPAEITAKAKAQAKLAGGAQVFTTHCAYCHERGIGPSLGGRGLDVATVATFVRNGPGPMPAFPPSQVSDADIAGVARYIATLPAPPAGKSAP